MGRVKDLCKVLAILRSIYLRDPIALRYRSQKQISYCQILCTKGNKIHKYKQTTFGILTYIERYCVLWLNT